MPYAFHMAILPPRRGKSHAERRAYLVASTAIFALNAAHEVLRVALDRPWRGIAPVLSDLVSLLLASLWIAAAFSLVMFQRHRRYHVPALMLGITGIFSMVAHGAITRVLGNPLGLWHSALAALLILLLRKLLVRRDDEPGVRARVSTT
jgi:hypothetical protein